MPDAPIENSNLRSPPHRVLSFGWLLLTLALLTGLTVWDGAPLSGWIDGFAQSFPIFRQDRELAPSASGAPGKALPHWKGMLDPATSETLDEHFTALNYTLQDLPSGSLEVPRILLSSLPPDLAEVKEIGRRKSLFIRGLLPVVLKENEQLEKSRARLISIRRTLRQGKTLESEARTWLAGLYERFKSPPGKIALLSGKVDVIPPSLAIAQAAMESGWGTSRFAKEGNALFGQWTWSDSHRGMVPRQRPQGMKHRVRAFPSLQKAVRSYMRVLNTSAAYKGFRRLRAAQREKGRNPSGLSLAKVLRFYSQRRHLYTNQIRSLILANNLQRLDSARLADHRSARQGLQGKIVLASLP